jgi:hypothetical protein
VGARLVGLIDDGLTRWANRPVKVRVKASPGGILQGRFDVVVVELTTLPVAGLVVDRLLFHAEDVRIQPGLPARLKVKALGAKAVIAQADVDRWTKGARLPFRLGLSDEGVLMSAGVGGIKMGEMLTAIEVEGSMATLRPVRAAMFGRQAPLVNLMRGYLPLPPLPAGVRLVRVVHSDGELVAYFDLGELDEPLTPGLARRLRHRLLLPR